MSQAELPFTKVPNVVLDEWINRLALTEIRLAIAIVRRSFGWHREKTEPLRISDFCKITRRGRRSVLEGLQRLKRYGLIDGSRLSRQDAFEYNLIIRPFKALKEAPPAAKQKALPFDVSSFQRCRKLHHSEVQKIAPLRGAENCTTETPVLLSIKERDLSLDHTQRNDPPAVENIAARRVCGSRFTREKIRAYADANHYYTRAVNDYWAGRGLGRKHTGGINNPGGWTTIAARTGEHDEEIAEWLNDPEIFNFEYFLQAQSC